MSEIRFSCPNCDQHILGDTLWSGREISCPACQQPLIAPSVQPNEPTRRELAPETPATAATSPIRAPDCTVSPDNPLRIPLVVRIYGILTMVLSVLGIVVLVLYIVPGGDALGLIIGGVVILLMAVVFRIGMGLRSGERQAVYGFCLLALLDVVFRLFSFVAKHDMQHLWFLAFALGLFYIPPVVSAFRHWAAFK